MKTFVLASGNQGKFNELQQALSPYDIALKKQSDFGIGEVEETGLTFVENAIIKARYACKISGLPAIADDSGLEVDALNGAPGIYSARFAGDNADDAQNNRKLISSLQGIPEEQRSARFQCVLVFMKHDYDPTPIIACGSWEGRISDTPKGANGFGYDPHFVVNELGCHSAELTKEKKNTISHRAKALKQLMAQIHRTVQA